MTTTKGVTLNTNCRRIKFARRFITTLLRMRKTRPSSSLSMEADVRKRSQRIKIAAYSAMAHAVGPRRAWSRAVLFKLRSRARHQSMIRRRSFRLQKKRVVKNDNIPSGEVSQADKLRQLVPGGKAMDVCSLLEETAHYISCLATQAGRPAYLIKEMSNGAGTEFIQEEDLQGKEEGLPVVDSTRPFLHPSQSSEIIGNFGRGQLEIAE